MTLTTISFFMLRKFSYYYVPRINGSIDEGVIFYFIQNSES